MFPEVCENFLGLCPPISGRYNYKSSKQAFSKSNKNANNDIFRISFRKIEYKKWSTLNTIYSMTRQLRNLSHLLVKSLTATLNCQITT